MQYIEGQTLAQVIGQLREASQTGKAEKTPDAGGTGILSVLSAGTGETPEDVGWGEAQRSPSKERAISELGRQLNCRPNGDSLAPDSSSHQFFRAVAQLGIQAAEALEHARQMGIVHRDIKA